MPVIPPRSNRTQPIDQSDPNGIGGRLVGNDDNHVDLLAISYRLQF
jgi:hypothetical protein